MQKNRTGKFRKGDTGEILAQLVFGLSANNKKKLNAVDLVDRRGDLVEIKTDFTKWHDTHIVETENQHTHGLGGIALAVAIGAKYYICIRWSPTGEIKFYIYDAEAFFKRAFALKAKGDCRDVSHLGRCGGGVKWSIKIRRFKDLELPMNTFD
jgi:hypothetical protein